MHKVLLVNRDLRGQQLQPVSGKSGKLYGNATYNPEYSCPVFSMSLEDYEKAADDVMGNTFAGQQWVPVFKVAAPAPEQRREATQPTAPPDETPPPATDYKPLLSLFSVNELRALAKKLNADTRGTRDDLMASISEKVSTD